VRRMPVDVTGRQTEPSLFVKGFQWLRGRAGSGRRLPSVAGVGSAVGPGVACVEAPAVRTLGRSRRLVKSFPELPSRACQLRRAASATRRR
jgi:hypothetical protein